MDTFLQAFISYSIIVDPVGVALIFHAMSDGKGDHYRRKMAVRAVIISFCLVIFFGFLGDWLLGLLGISLDSFKIAGGLLLFYTASSMVIKPDNSREEEKTDHLDDISVFPLSIPLLAGPGCLTLTVLVFAGEGKNLLDYSLLMTAIIVVFAITLVCLLGAGYVSKVMGETANSIMKRLLGVLLAALSIQFIADGIKGFIV